MTDKRKSDKDLRTIITRGCGDSACWKQKRLAAFYVTYDKDSVLVIVFSTAGFACS